MISQPKKTTSEIKKIEDYTETNTFIETLDNAQSNNAYQHTNNIQAPSVLTDIVRKTGVSFNGQNPWDVRIHNQKAYHHILQKGSLGFGEAYMEGYWDASSLDQLFTRLLHADADQLLPGWARLRLIAQNLRYRFFNLQSKERSFQVGEQHYDIGNDIYEAMLDSTMSYSCGFWQYAVTLEQAQKDKLEMICRKLQLQPGERLLDIGCGWGGLAQYAATYHGVEVLGITVSKEQERLAKTRCKNLPVTIKLIDYRDLDGKFDKIASVGMFEHVGSKNYTTYFEHVARLMKPDALFLLHSIGSHNTTRAVDPWIDKYIFPNGKLPSASEITVAIEETFLIEDWHNFGADYDKTLMAWMKNFDKAWPQLQHAYSERFYRMWKYYLMSSAGFFRSRQGQLWQIVMSKRERNKVYRSIR